MQITNDLFKNNEGICSFLRKEDRRVTMFGFWYKWRLYVELARVFALREKMSRIVTFMTEQNKHLKVIAERAVLRIKVLEGTSINGREEFI